MRSLPAEKKENIALLFEKGLTPSQISEEARLEFEDIISTLIDFGYLTGND